MNTCNKHYCEKCQTTYSDKRALNRHFKTKKHMGKSNKLFKCEACKYETYDQANWKRHTLTKKHKRGGSLTEGQKCTKCQLCLKQFMNNHSYRSHMSTHATSKVAFATEMGKMLGERRTLRKKLQTAQRIVDGKSYKSGVIHKPAVVKSMTVDEADDIVNTYPAKIEALSAKLKRYNEWYRTKLKDAPIHSSRDLRALEAKLEVAKTDIKRLDSKMERKDKALKDLSKNDQLRYARNEMRVNRLTKQIEALRQNGRSNGLRLLKGGRY